MTAILGDFWEANCGVCLHHQQIKLPATVNQQAATTKSQHWMPQTPQWPVPNPVFLFYFIYFQYRCGPKLRNDHASTKQQAPAEGKLRPILRVDHIPLSLFSDN